MSCLKRLPQKEKQFLVFHWDLSWNCLTKGNSNYFKIRCLYLPNVGPWRQKIEWLFIAVQWLSYLWNITFLKTRWVLCCGCYGLNSLWKPHLWTVLAKGIDLISLLSAMTGEQGIPPSPHSLGKDHLCVAVKHVLNLIQHMHIRVMKDTHAYFSLHFIKMGC